ncbi:jg26239 [Pararge aegeria aegeria]|uniref:Jg26239 protein n=1 Tax=Pararge aegeria aegeria TaxID=348720 RepID=A0A8S4QRM7_9NEOP|nr:jg26239 [Pararge aegeria aegeria]
MIRPWGRAAFRPVHAGNIGYQFLLGDIVSRWLMTRRGGGYLRASVGWRQLALLHDVSLTAFNVGGVARNGTSYDRNEGPSRYNSGGAVEVYTSGTIDRPGIIRLAEEWRLIPPKPRTVQV